MVSMDAGFLGLLLHPAARPPLDPTTDKPLIRAKDRIEALIEDLYTANERVVISTPALSEFLVLAENDAQQYLSELANQPGFYIRAFDQMAAIELAALELLARGKGGKRLPADANTPWQKVKFDRQIVAIAKVHQAHTIYSDDNGVRAFAENIGIKAISSWELPLPLSKTPLFDNLETPELSEESSSPIRRVILKDDREDV
jgi:predicted nucleic acid-binding protein